MKIKNILILAGGDGTRFWPLNNKILYPFLCKPLIQHVMDDLKKYAERIIVVTNKVNGKLIRMMDKNVKVIVQRNQEKGMADAVLSSRALLDQDVLIVNANDVFNPNIIEILIKENSEKGSDLSFVAKKVTSYFPGGYLQFDANGKLNGIREKPDPDKTPSNFVNLVVDYFKDAKKWLSVLESIHNNSDDTYEQALTEFIKKYKTNYTVYDDYWFTIKYPWQILPMMTHYLNTLNPKIKIGKNVTIASSAKIEGPCFIDDNTVIGDFALVRQSHIGKNCLIGGYSEVTRSYLGNNVSLHRNYVGDSVLGEDVLFGAEATTANFRFDEKTIKSKVGEEKIDTNLNKLGAIVGNHSKIGVNTTLLPGIKVGSHTFIAPGYTIAQDVEDRVFIFKKKAVKNLHKK